MNEIPAKSKWVESHPLFKQTPTLIGPRTYQVFSPLKANGPATFALYGEFVGKILERIEETALQKIGSSVGLFKINRNAINNAIEERLGAKVDFGSKQIEIALLGGLLLNDCDKCLKLAKTIAVKFFESLAEPLFSYNLKSADIKKWVHQTTIQSLNFLYSKLGMKQSDEPVSFTEEDLEIFQIQKDQIKSDPTQLSCLCYALLRGRVVEAKDLIFQKGADDKVLEKIFNHLPNWGYAQVTEPTPGDLVVYLKDKKPEHVGVYQGNDRVHSKIGIANPFSHTHHLFAVEHRAIFFHKSV